MYSALKPQNIVVDDDDYSANIDFNFGLGGSNQEIKYLAPEGVCVGVDDSLESERDIWALGCIVLEMLSGMDMWHNVGSEEEIERFLIRIREERGFLVLSDMISKDARGFLKACLGRYAAERLSAEELLDHPFVAAVDEVEEEEGLDELLEFVPLEVWGLVEEADGVEKGLEEEVLNFIALEFEDSVADDDVLQQEEEIVKSVSGLDDLDYIPLEVEESSDACLSDDFIPLEVEHVQEGSDAPVHIDHEDEAYFDGCATGYCWVTY